MDKYEEIGQCTNNCWIKNKLTGEMENISNATMFARKYPIQNQIDKMDALLTKSTTNKEFKKVLKEQIQFLQEYL